MMGHWEIAKRAAWAEFGSRYWRWVVYGPIAVRVMGVLVSVAGMMAGMWWIAQHVEGWLAWLGWLASAYLIPMLLVALGVSIYAVGAVIIWRLNGWRWKFNGFSTARYSFMVMAIMVIGITLVGVTAV